MARWLDLDTAAGVALLGRGLGSGSEGEDDDGECEGEGDAGEGRGGAEGCDGCCASGGREVQWEDAQKLEGDSWRHEIAHCPRALPSRPDGREQIGGAVASGCHLNVHRLTLGAEDAASLNCSLAALALCHEVAAAGCKREASNVGGFHSEVDVLAWEEIRRSTLPALLSNALEQVERAESAALGREALQFAPAATEAWLNVSRRGHWNHLHSHPGATYSGTYYVSDGACREQTADCLSGRLVLMPAAPPQLSRHNLDHLHYTTSLVDASTAAGAAAGDATADSHGAPAFGSNAAIRVENAGGRGVSSGCGGEVSEECDDNSASLEASLVFVAVDPVPGSMIVFPSFVPHFVLPTTGGVPGGQDSSEQTARISLAFNFVAR